MKTIQKFELLAGIFTLLSILLSLYGYYIYPTKRIAESGLPSWNIIVGTIIPALLFAIGAYIHTTKRKGVGVIGLLMLFVCGGWLSLIYFANSMMGRTSNIPPLLYILPGFFAITTIFLAIVNVLFFAGDPSEQPRRRKM